MIENIIHEESKHKFLKIKNKLLILLPLKRSICKVFHQRISRSVTWICGFCSRWKSSLQSDEMCVLVDNKSRTSTSISIEFDSTGKNLSSLTLLRILLWTFTRALSSFDCSNSLKNPNSSSVQLGISDLLSCSEFSSLDNAEIINNKWITFN